MVKVNDVVRFLNDVGGGRITKVDGNTVYVEDHDGFERPVLAREVVVVGDGTNRASDYERPLKVKPLVVPDKPAPKQKTKPDQPVFETPEGEKLNIVLAYGATELKHLSTTTFYSVLVNDSNYYLSAAYMSRRDADGEWLTRWCGIIEPNMQVDLDEFGHDNLQELEHVAVQYIAYKQDKGFKLKNPALVEQKLDVTKFYKLHCFHDNEYFDDPMITVPITRNDLPTRQLVIDSGALERAMREKRTADHPAPHLSQTRNTGKKNELIVQDLHIAALLDNLHGLTNKDILDYQLRKFREVMKANEKKGGQKIVFIHGKGEGVLRKNILDELKRKWPHCSAQDASFQEYGFGATQVTIHK